jgi:hypothetical protein
VAPAYFSVAGVVAVFDSEGFESDLDLDEEVLNTVPSGALRRRLRPKLLQDIICCGHCGERL